MALISGFVVCVVRKSFFVRFVLNEHSKNGRFVSDSAKIWICGLYIPRFDHDITEEEAIAYMKKWMQRYYVPNPFTKRGFINITPPINLLYGLVDYLENHPDKPNLITAGAALFGGEMGNVGCVKFVLNEYSQIIEVDHNNDMKLLVNKSGKIDVLNNRDDKQAFFKHFNG